MILCLLSPSLLWWHSYVFKDNGYYLHCLQYKLNRPTCIDPRVRPYAWCMRGFPPGHMHGNCTVGPLIGIFFFIIVIPPSVYSAVWVNCAASLPQVRRKCFLVYPFFPCFLFFFCSFHLSITCTSEQLPNRLGSSLKEHSTELAQGTHHRFYFLQV